MVTCRIVRAAMVAGYQGLRAYPASLIFEDSLRQRVLASGDIVVHPIPHASASYPGSWRGVIDKLKAYDFAFLVPGHGSIQTNCSYLDKLQAAIIDIESQVEPLAAKGRSLNEVRKAMQFSRLQDEFAGDVARDRSQMRDFFLKALVSNVFRTAKGDPIVQGRDGR